MAALMYLISLVTRTTFYHRSARLAFRLKLWEKVKIESLKLANDNDSGNNN